MLAMLTFLTGLFGRIGIMAYYFIYVMGNPVLIAGFATAMSAGMLVVNFYAPFLLNRFSKKYVGPIHKVRLRVAPAIGKAQPGQISQSWCRGRGIHDLRVSREIFRENRRGAKRGNEWTRSF